MTRTTRWMLILCFIVASIAVAWDLTPLTAGRDKGKGNVSAAGLMQKQSGKREDSARTGTQEKGKAPEAKRVDLDLPEGDEEEDPDLPPGMAGRIDKEAYLRSRGDYFDLLRGREGEVPRVPVKGPSSRWNDRRRS